MAERYDATVHVRRLPRRLELGLIVKRGNSIRLVQFPQIDVGHGELVVFHEFAD